LPLFTLDDELMPLGLDRPVWHPLIVFWIDRLSYCPFQNVLGYQSCSNRLKINVLIITLSYHHFDWTAYCIKTPLFLLFSVTEPKPYLIQIQRFFFFSIISVSCLKVLVCFYMVSASAQSLPHPLCGLPGLALGFTDRLTSGFVS